MVVGGRGRGGALSRTSADQALDEACAAVGLDAAGSELIRLGSGAVYRVGSQIVARVNLGTADDARREVLVARWLASEGFPATRALDVDQPVVAAGHLVTFWKSVSERAEHASTGQVAAVIRDFHRLDPPASLRLPDLDPFARSPERLDSLSGLRNSGRRTNVSAPIQFS